MADDGALAGTGDADIRKAALLLQALGALFVHRALIGEHPFLPAGQEHGVELQALGAVQRHQADLIRLRVFLVLHHQGNVIEEPFQGLEICQRADQFF